MLEPSRRTQAGRRRFAAGAGALLAASAVAGCATMWRPALEPQAHVPVFDAATVASGERLAALGNCAACHTADPARPYAGGVGVATPFGTVYSTNITPAADTGIGRYSEAAFTRALREGVARDGHLLYPAFPYDHYTRLTQDDIRALYAYFMTRPPLDAPAHPNDLRFPFNFRPLVGVWNTLYLKREPWMPDPRRSAAWNRGAYVADALAHCSACHSPRTRLGGEDRMRFLDGGEAEDWYAPSLNANSPSPLPWTHEQLVAYLRTGIAPEHAVAGGPMQGVVENLGRADPADVDALATWLHSYLQQAPARATNAARPGALPAPAAADPDQLKQGYDVYAGACARCHEAGRAATSGTALPLQQAVALYDPDPRSLLHIVRDGIAPPGGAPARWMPAFAGILDDGQAAALAAYLRRYGAARPAWPDLEDSVRKARQP
ncbi:cytochrome c [Massilia putida]|uniref:cytochrome c n=1 Tax=Massilia putida TaxID=1141883 RepID=UPI0009524219|nr:cytochrome c [Massilia putida]